VGSRVSHPRGRREGGLVAACQVAVLGAGRRNSELHLSRVECRACEIREGQAAEGEGWAHRWCGPATGDPEEGASSARAGPGDCSGPPAGGEGQEVFETMDASGDSCPAHLRPLASDPHTGPPSTPSRGHPSILEPRDLERRRVPTRTAPRRACPCPCPTAVPQLVTRGNK